MIFETERAVIYVHGKGGNSKEAEHYEKLFTDADIFGLEYKAENPWDCIDEFKNLTDGIFKNYEKIILIANSIGAFFSMYALSDMSFEKIFFISPIVNMERLIDDMMHWANVTEDELKNKKIIETEFGETLSWEYLSWVRNHPVSCNKQTNILYAGHDNLQSRDTILDFAHQIDADVTIMEDGEHWFHTEEQMEFLDKWIRSFEDKEILNL